MTDLTATKKFASTIGAEAFARDTFEGEFPLAVTVNFLTRKGLVAKTYTMPRKPTDADLLPVGVITKQAK